MTGLPPALPALAATARSNVENCGSYPSTSVGSCRFLSVEQTNLACFLDNLTAEYEHRLDPDVAIAPLPARRSSPADRMRISGARQGSG